MSDEEVPQKQAETDRAKAVRNLFPAIRELFTGRRSKMGRHGERFQTPSYQ
jgi:hypothetical protein